jgi:hypothetical protein
MLAIMLQGMQMVVVFSRVCYVNMLFNTVFLYYIACDYLSMKLYGQILYPALLGNYWINEMYFIIIIFNLFICVQT